MDNKLLNKLTKQDIGEIADMLKSVDSPEIDSEKRNSEVLKQLRKTNEDYKPYCKDRYKTLLEIAEKITEHHYQDNRQFGNVLIKCLVSNRLREEEYTLSEIGRAMNKHHSTIMFYLDKMKDMSSLPLIYANEMRMRSLFNYAIEEHDEQE